MKYGYVYENSYSAIRKSYKEKIPNESLFNCEIYKENLPTLKVLVFEFDYDYLEIEKIWVSLLLPNDYTLFVAICVTLLQYFLEEALATLKMCNKMAPCTSFLLIPPKSFYLEK